MECVKFLWKHRLVASLVQRGCLALYREGVRPCTERVFGLVQRGCLALYREGCWSCTERVFGLVQRGGWSCTET